MSIKHVMSQTITEHRKKQKLSQDKIAAQADLSNRFYRAIESGEKMASISSAFKIAKALNIHYSIIMEPVWEYWLEHQDEEPAER